MSSKPFFTYDKQIEKLREKGLEIPDEQRVKQLLKKFSYFALVSGYKRPFKNKKGMYKIHTTIDDIYYLYNFDNDLRALFLKYILKIEDHIKSLMSYSFCDKYGEEQEAYLKSTNYNYSQENQNEINKLITKLTEVVCNKSRYPYMEHQKRKYNNIPLWVLMKALTLGTVSRMYSLLNQSVQISISKEYEGVNESELAQMINILSRFRNVCAHNERLFDYKYSRGQIDDTMIHSKLLIRNRFGNYEKGKNDLFAVVIVLCYLLDRDSFCEFIDSLKILIKDLTYYTKRIEQKQILKLMGFPETWYDIKDLLILSNDTVCGEQLKLK